MTDAAVWESAGLLAPGDDERRALLAFLHEQGCTLEEMVAADRRGRLYALAGDRLLLPSSGALTLAEVAARVGAGVEDVQRLWRALGLPNRGTDVPVVAEHDLSALTAFLAVEALVGPDEALALARVIGASAARIADAGDAALRRLADLDLDRSGGELVTARSWAAVAGLVPGVVALLDVVLRHHVEAVRALVESSRSSDVAADGLVRMGIGFADLSGWTALSAGLTPAQLSSLVTRFEEVSLDVVGGRGGRVVKFLGDAVMWVCPRPADLATTALDLVAAAAAEGHGARAGVVHDLLLSRDGDYFGAGVNLAARLVALAGPGEVLAPAGLGGLLAAGGFDVDADLPPLAVRGVAEPVAVAVVRAAPRGERSFTSER